MVVVFDRIQTELPFASYHIFRQDATAKCPVLVLYCSEFMSSALPLIISFALLEVVKSTLISSQSLKPAFIRICRSLDNLLRRKTLLNSKIFPHSLRMLLMQLHASERIGGKDAILL